MGALLQRAWAAGAMTGLLLTGCSIQSQTNVSIDKPTEAPTTSQSSITVSQNGITVSTDSNGADGSTVVVQQGGTVNSSSRVYINGKLITSQNGVMVISGSGSETRTIEASAPAKGVTRLRAKSDYGAISVVPAPDATTVRVSATVTLGTGLAHPKQLIAGFRARLENANGVLTPTVVPPANFPQNAGFVVSYKIAVPPSVALDLKSDNGAIAVRDTRTTGKVKVQSGYGSVRVGNAGSDIEATSDNGSVTVEGIRAGASVVAKSGYGRVEVSGDAGAIDAESENGSVSVSGTTNAKRINARSGYGSVALTDCSGDAITAHSDNGSVTFRGTPGDLSLGSGYGSIDATIRDASNLRSAEIESDNGSVALSLPQNARAAIDATSDSGTVSVNDAGRSTNETSEHDVYKATWNNGAATVRLHSGYGSVSITGTD